jgi:hypothetical protein
LACVPVRATKYNKTLALQGFEDYGVQKEIAPNQRLERPQKICLNCTKKFCRVN